MAPPDEKPPEKSGRLQKYRENLLEKLVLTLPIGLISAAATALQSRLVSSPWTAVWLVIPLALAVWLTWRLLKKPGMGRSLLLGLAFLTVYGGIFALASVSDVLVWRQVPHDNQSLQLRGWMLPVRAGDWRYAIARRKAPQANDIVIVLLTPPAGPDPRPELRAREAGLIMIATEQGARGVGLDMYFDSHSSSDDLLCKAVSDARAAGTAVWAGFTNKNLGDGRIPVSTNTSSLPCFSAKDLGSLIGFGDSDGRVRAVRLNWDGMQDQPSFSVLGAQVLAASYGREPEPLTSDDDVLRYLPPPQALPVYSDTEVLADPGILKERLVLVGLNVLKDRFHTPFGVQPGTVIQASAIHSLNVKASITRPKAAWNALVVAVLCYLIVVMALSGMPATRLILVVTGLSLGVVLVSALLMYAWLMWFEVVYALVAMWLLVPLVLVARRSAGLTRLS